MKNLAFLLGSASLVGSMGVYAALPTGAAPFQIVIPNLPSGLEVTIEGLLLQPTNSDLYYVPSAFQTAIAPVVISMPSIDPGYGFGFRVGLGYVFPNSGNDIQLNWTHFNNSNLSNTTENLEVEPIVPLIPIAVEDVTSSSNTNFKYDAIDLDIGQYLSVGTRLTVRLFTGLRFAQLQNNADSNSTSTVIPPESQISPIAVAAPPATDMVITSTMQSKFTGIGPRFGVQTHYHVANHFGVVTHIDAALLIGRVESSLTYNNTFITINSAASNGNTLFNSPALDYDPTANAPNTTRVVPAFDAKLGIDYSIPFHNDTSHSSIELGYQVTQYIDAIDKVHITEDSLEGSTSYSTTTSSIGFNGPYLSINFKV